MKVCGWGEQESQAGKVIIEELQKNGLNIDWLTFDEGQELRSVAAQFKAYDMGLLLGGNCLKANQFVNHRTVGGHLLNYFDFIVNRGGVLWGEALFARSFYENLLSAFKNQNFKGPVIFLGDQGRALPVFETLASFGFTDFDFLSLENEGQAFKHISKYVSSLFDTSVAQVDSASFIRSQKEYSLCFVAKDYYRPQTLDDMSYFHFLSSRSIVFDLSGQSNFLFKEVMALGVDVVDYLSLEKNFASHVIGKIKNS